MQNSSSLPAKYRPQTLPDVKGQSEAVQTLQGFVRAVQGTSDRAAFIFHGPTGVGKTSAAWALAFDLGCDKEDPMMGGIDEIPSGIQDGAAVQAALRSMILRPLFGSGWKVLIVNEADRMTPQAETIWLDGLEKLPPKTVVIFTTNNLETISARLASRCELVEFTGDPAVINGAFGKFIKHVWKQETGKALRCLPEGLGVFDIAGGTISFRLALQQIGPFARDGRDLPQCFQPPIVRGSETAVSTRTTNAAKKAWATRRKEVTS